MRFSHRVAKLRQRRFLLGRQPLLSALQHVWIDRDAVTLRDLQAVDDVRGFVRRRVLAPAAKPAPAAVGQLQRGQARHAGVHAVAQFIVIEDGIDVGAFPLRGPLQVVADFLRVQVGELRFDVLEVQVHAQQHFLRDHRGQEARERLLCAAVGIVDEVRNGIDHGAGESRRITDFDAAVFRTALGRNGEAQRRRSLFRTDRARKRIHLFHAVHIGRKSHLHCIGLFVGDRFHAHHRLAGGQHFHAPVDALFAFGIDFDFTFAIRMNGAVGWLAVGAGHAQHGQLQAGAFELQDDLHSLFRGEIVVDVGRDHDLVLLRKEARRLQADEQVLGGDGLRLALPHPRARAQRPDFELPGRQTFRHGHVDAGQTVGANAQLAAPERGVGEIAAHGRFDVGAGLLCLLLALVRPFSPPLALCGSC